MIMLPFKLIRATEYRSLILLVCCFELKVRVCVGCRKVFLSGRRLVYVFIKPFSLRCQQDGVFA